MRILITGSSGWLGTTLVPRLRRDGHEVVGMDPVETVAGVAQRNYQRWRSVQDEIFKTLMNAAGRGGRDGEDKSSETASHQ